MQFCANDPDTFAAAVRKLDPATCDAVDLNLGYSQHPATFPALNSRHVTPLFHSVSLSRSLSPTPTPYTLSVCLPLALSLSHTHKNAHTLSSTHTPDTFAAAVRKLDPATGDAVVLNLGYRPSPSSSSFYFFIVTFEP